MKKKKEKKTDKPISHKKQTPIKLPEIDLKALLKAGCHFGHRVARTHPKIRPYLYTSRNKIQIFDLIQTGQLLDEARRFLTKLAAGGDKVIFVGTKRQAKKIIRQVAQKAEMPFVNTRWLGGTLTNWNEMKKRIKKYKELQEQLESKEFKKRTKREQSLMRKEVVDLREKFGGMTSLQKLPEAIFIVDVIREKVAVSEARRLGIPIVAIVDSNGDPTQVDYPIPGNDDARKSVELLTTIIGEAVEAGAQLDAVKESEKVAKEGENEKE